MLYLLILNIKQLLNSVLVGHEELLRQRFVLSDNTNLCLNNSSYPTRTEFNNCFIIYLYLRTFSLNYEEVICILNFGISSISHLYFAFGIRSMN